MIKPTCQVCGTTLNLEDGSGIETVIRRGADDDDSDVEDWFAWSQELRFRFCGQEHMNKWMGTFSLPVYEPPKEEKSSLIRSLAEGILGAAFCALLLAVLTGGVYGFLLLLARVF